MTVKVVVPFRRHVNESSAAQIVLEFGCRYTSVFLMDQSPDSSLAHEPAAKIIKTESIEQLGPGVQQALISYLHKYLRHLHHECTDMPFGVHYFDDSNVNYSLDRASSKADDLYLPRGQVRSVNVPAINKYLYAKWRRAVRPECPSDRLLAALSEINSFWAVRVPITDQFIVRFDAPEVEANCPHSVVLTLKVEDITFINSDARCGQPFADLKLY